MKSLLKDAKGQMTVELVVAFPVLIVVAVIATNALQFFSQCAMFDRIFDEEVRLMAVSPEANSDVAQSCAKVEQQLQHYFDAMGQSVTIEVDVSWQQAPMDLDRFEATMKFHPTLFSLELCHEIWGVSLPTLNHSKALVVDCYKAGVLV